MPEDKIDMLKKVTLSIKAGTTPDGVDQATQSPNFEFIFGLGTSGLTPFEFELAGKTVGDEVLLHISRDNFSQAFQHLLPPPLDVPDHLDAFYLKVQVQKVITADQKEVIKALAEIANCEDHCCGH